MDRRTRLAAVVVLALVATAAAIVVAGGDGGRTGRTATGVIVGVDSAGLDDVRSFSLRTVDGTVLEFALGSLENETEFPPGHLAEHQATGDPVTVTYDVEGSRNIAIRIGDGP